MKKKSCIILWLILVALSGTVFAEVPGLILSGSYSRGALGSVNQPGQLQQEPDGVYSVGAYPLYTPELAQGEGLEIVRIYCRFCHSTAYIAMQPALSSAVWEGVVNKMINTYGAPISEDSAKQIVSYLRMYYTQKNR